MTEAKPGLPARIIQVVARFRPDADGVGETALNLANVLLGDHGVRSDFLVYNSPHPEPALEIADDFPHTIKRVLGAGAAPFNSALDRLAAAHGPAPVMLLHYVPYGYSRQGVPTWLPPAMERFTGRGGRLLSLFHELYALPRFPSRTLFTSWLQRRIFRRLLAASEFVFSSSQDFLEVIARNNYLRRPASLIGICSSAGEPENPKPLDQRARRLAVFGRFTTRKRLYENHLPQLAQVARHLGIEEIADIGAIEDPRWFDDQVAGRLGPLLRSYGTLGVSSASRLLEDSLVGVLDYPCFLRGKSSIYAAYQAHAAAILLFPAPGPADPHDEENWPLGADELLALPAQSPALFDRLRDAAAAGHRHYRRHRSARSMVDTLLPALKVAGSGIESAAAPRIGAEP
ncbi:MAG: hypothetical protein WBE76_10405 [Terracidiphilus sp.]